MKRAIIFLTCIILAAHAQAPLELIHTMTGVGNFGKVVIGGYDINGGGVPDIAVGSYAEGEGVVYLYFGESLDTIPDLVFKGENMNDWFGYAIAFCPDITGESDPELIIGAPYFPGGGAQGRVYIYQGGPGMDTTADYVLLNPSGTPELFGFALAAGNTDGIWPPDVAIGAPFYLSGADFIGRVYLFTNYTTTNDTTIFEGEGTWSYDYYGWSLAIGRMDADAIEDLLVGAPNAESYAGKAYLYYGSAGMDTTADLAWQGSAGTSDYLGNAVASCGDINFDSMDDFALSIPYRNEGAGEVYIIYGKVTQDTTPDVILYGENSYDYFGTSVAAAGDVNNDSRADILIGAPNYNNGLGKAYLYITPFDTIYDGFADAPDIFNQFGMSVAGCGDLDGDSHDDVIVGSDGSLGRAYVYKGRSDFVPPLIDSVTHLSDTSFTGPFIISAYIYDASGISVDSLYYNVDSGGYVALPHDSVLSDMYYFTIPQQAEPAKVPIRIEWFLMARDANSPGTNVTYAPFEGEQNPFVFQILDLTGPTIANVTVWPDTTFTGPYPVICDVTDVSGVAQVKLHYRISTGGQNWLPMFPTGNPDEYSATLPIQASGRIVGYSVEAVDSFVTPNTCYEPADYPTPYAFCVEPFGLEIMLVDGDKGDSIEVYYTYTLDSLNINYYYWSDTWGSPRNALDNHFTVLLWYTAQVTTDILVPADMDSLTEFFGRGGKLFISSQNLGEDIGSTSFYQNTMHSIFDNPNANQNFAIAVPGDSVSDIYKDTIALGGLGGANNSDSEDRIFPADAETDSVYVYRTIGGSAAIKYHDGASGHKLVYFAFPWEALNASPMLFAQRGPVMASVLQWFGVYYGITEHPSNMKKLVFALSPVSPNPFKTRATISYSVPTREHICLKIYDLSGRLVDEKVNTVVDPGIYHLKWDGTDINGRQVASGVYFIVLENATKRLQQKVVMIE